MNPNLEEALFASALAKSAKKRAGLPDSMCRVLVLVAGSHPQGG